MFGVKGEEFSAPRCVVHRGGQIMNRNDRPRAALATFVVVACLSAAGLTQAQTTSATPDAAASTPAASRMELRQACKADIQTLCGDVEHGGGRKMACMKAHEDQLSAPCKAALVQLRASRAAASGPSAP
jgi:hypothetical protein